MILRRRKRTTGWVMALGALPAMLFLIQIDDRAGGSFQVRPVTRAELRAPVAAFLKEVHFDEGDRVSPGALVARLDVPDLPSRMAQKHGEISQIEAKLRQLRNWEAGSHRAQLGEIPPTPDTLNAQLVRLKEELQYLEQIQQKLLVDSPVAGLITTPHLKEKVGHYFREGDLICDVEEPSVLEAEIALPEQQVARVEPGQRVELKARALPFQTFKAKVNRVAPSAVPGEVQSTVTIYCRLEATSAELRPRMTGYARIYTGRRPIGWILANRVLRFLRTEFWW